MRNIDVAIVIEALNRSVFTSNGLWPDDVDVTAVAASDKNCVGSAWRLLTKAGILEVTTDFRRSKAEGARGRKIFKYLNGSAGKARTFLKRNGGSYQQPQGQLFND